MPSNPMAGIDLSLLTFVHLSLLTAFMAATTLMLALAVINWLRLRNILLTWRTGRILGLPSRPFIFLVVLTALFTVALALGKSAYLWVFIGYFLGGTFWMSASLLATSVVITRYGLTAQANRARYALRWSRVVDYFVRSTENGEQFVFFYLDDEQQRQRLELDVPRRYTERLRTVLHQHVDEQFNLQVMQAYGKRALEG